MNTISLAILSLLFLLFAVWNFKLAVRAGDWLYDRVSTELTVLGILLSCSPTIGIVLWWLK